ncbi:MAG: type IX secretion system membrane protein PorP/SprF [Bacteroidetes bacterium]|nr:type IX secretion system membrane protein PorP/SprF [Bacteroidota bacterium]
MKHKIFLIGFMWMTLLVTAQQDPQYSQYQFNQMVINPAYAGSRDALSAVVDVRQQWSGFDGAPRTQAFSLHGPLKKKRIGLGLSGYSDQIGPKKIVAVYGSFAYILPITNKLKLSFGLRGGMVNYNIDWNKISYKDQSESFVNSAVNPKPKFDMDAGVFLKSNTFFVGASITHLNGASIYKIQSYGGGATGTAYYDVSYKLDPHVFIVAGKAWSLGDNLVFNPTLLIKRTRDVGGADLNLNFLIKQRVWAGVFFRSDATIGFLTQVYVTDKLRIGYAFDTATSSVQRRLGAGHEIMIGFDFNTFKSKMLSPRTL